MSTFPVLGRATLGIIAGSPAARVPGGVVCNVSNTRTYRELARHAGRTLLSIVLLPERTPAMNDTLEWKAEDLLALPPLASTRAAQRHMVETFRAVREVARRSDVLFIRMPFQIPWALIGLDKPKLLHFGGDVYEIVKASTDYRGLARFAALGYARLGEATFRHLIKGRRTRVATNGRAMLDKYGAHDNGIAVVSSCLHEAEMAPCEPRPPADPPRILFVGYLRPEKGLTVLLDAFERVRAQRPVVLTLAGGADRSATGAVDEMEAKIAASPYASDIRRVGHVPFGEPLFDLYRTHDLLVLPSLSEGTPRALIEARAFNCPVVSTRVGGIPLSVSDGEDGLLCPPGDAGSLATAIERLLGDLSLRDRIVEAGWARARATSVERFTALLAGQLEVALGGTPATEMPAA